MTSPYYPPDYFKRPVCPECGKKGLVLPEVMRIGVEKRWARIRRCMYCQHDVELPL